MTAANDYADLSPSKRELLELLLAEQGGQYNAFPLSYAQRRLWFLHQLEPDSPAYNISTAVRFRGEFNIEALEASFNEVIRRHEVLRTGFVTVEGSPVQVISPELSLPIPIIDLSLHSRDEKEAEMRRLATAESQRPFNLSRGPLVRAHLLRLAAADHLIIFVMHHIISDGWSSGILTKEVITIYEALNAGKPSPLPELPIQYADFAVWQREWLQGDVLDNLLSYWKQHLAGAPPLLELPTDRPRPQVQSLRGGMHHFQLSTQLSGAIKSLSQREGATLFITSLTAFNVLMYRYSRQQDVVVGTLLANRNRPEVKGLIGFFVNTLPLRTDLSGDPTFLELLGRVREVATGAFAHQDLPFEQLVDALQPERRLSHNPLIQVVFTAQNQTTAAPVTSTLSLSSSEIESGTSKFDITLTLVDTDRSVFGAFEYNTDLFDEATIKRMIGNFDVLLEAIICDPQRRIADLPLLTHGERLQLLEEWNSTRRDYSHQRLIHHLFEEQAKLKPCNIALEYQQTQLTYGDLNRKANQLARRLMSLGVGVESVVGICAQRSLEMVIGLLAILKAGGAYLPLDPAYPKERLAFMLEDANLTALLTQKDLIGLLPDATAQSLCLDSDWDSVAVEDDSDIGIEIEGDNLAYVIYTSGSTGKPKGAMNTHRAILNRLLWMQETYQLTDDDCVLQKTPFSFDVSVWEFFWPLIVGAGMALAKPGGHQDSRYLVELIAEQQITTLHFVPSMLQMFLSEDELEKCNKSLRRVICSGEALSVELQRRFYEKLDAELHNLYGPTEAAVDVTYWRCQRNIDAQRVPIGRPISNIQILILDDRLQPVPIGVPGELHIGGMGLARGYLNRPDLTAERFIANPFSDQPGERLYKTGDLARYLPDGSIDFAGRLDHQVKIRGFRVELGEIEEALKQYDGIQDAAVLVHETAEGDRRLVSYVVRSQPEAVSINALRSYLKEKLPEFMAPSNFIFLEALPLNPNGKLDRRLLPAPGRERPELEDTFVAPRVPVEEVLAAIWSQALGVDRIGVHDNFFALGGDSIRSIQVVALAKDRNIHFTLQQTFKHQTIAELAREIASSDSQSPAKIKTEPFCMIGEQERSKLPADVEDAYPLTQLQIGMLYHIAMQPDSPVYHNINSFQLRAKFDSDALLEAVDNVVARHPVLRTSFDLSNYSEPLQLVHREASLPLDIEDLRCLTFEQQEAAINEYLKSEEGHRFDLSTCPLLRFKIHLRGDDLFQFTLTECHAIHDGWSLQSTLAEIFSNYFAMLNDEPVKKPPPLSSQFRDFVMLERLALQSEQCQAFWAEKLSDCAVMELPGRPSANSSGERRVRKARVVISQATAEGLRRFARHLAVPLKSVLLAAHLKALGAISGQDDVLTGLSTHGRPEEIDGANARGLFLNTLPLRMHLSAHSWAELVKKAFAAEQEMLPFRRYPLAAIQKHWGDRPLFETLFNFIHFHVLDGLLASDSIEVLGFKGTEETSFKLAAQFSVAAHTAELTLDLDYDSNHISDEQADDFSGYYARALEAMANDPFGRHSELCLLPEAEKQRLLIEWNDTQTDYPRNQSVAELFEQQVETSPDAIAVIFEQGHLTYGELNKLANRLAHRLRRLGIGPEAPVIICLERSVEMVVAALAVLKSGGAYVPLDPTYPKERLAFMLDDVKAAVVLTQERALSRASFEASNVICLDSAWQEMLSESPDNLLVTVEPENLAYVIYTSGSTGKPKGVAVPHRGVVRLVKGTNYAKFGPEDVMLQFAPISFDASTLEMWASLANGGKLILAPSGALSLDELGDIVEQGQVTTMWLTAGLFNRMVENNLASLKNVKQLLAGGDALSAVHVTRALQELKHTTLINGYGPTENTTFTCCHPMNDAEQVDASIPIGRPIANTQVYLLDSNLLPVPVGVAGELYIAGDGLARGYFERPDLTAEKFMPNPFGKQPGARMYRSGDLARYLPSGAIEFLCRIDRQVKIRGFRIELGEIEATLSQHPDVKDAVVTASEDKAGDKRLIAYTVLEDGAASEAAEFKEFLRARLPDYMIPSVFVLMPSFPLLPNGKVNRQALPDAEDLRSQSRPDYVSPQTEAERVIAAIWQEALHIGNVGRDENFFDLGGHSLSMVQLHSKLREAFNKDLSMIELFRHATVSRMAEYVSGNESEQVSFEQSQKRAAARRDLAMRQPQLRRQHRRKNAQAATKEEV